MAKKDLRSHPSTRAASTMLPFHSIAPTLNTQLMPRRVIRCGLRPVIKIVTPSERDVLGGQHRMLVAVKDAVAVLLRAVGLPDESPVPLLQLLELLGE